MHSLFSYALSTSDLIIIISVALLVGMSKTGVQGAGMISVPLLAVVFGGQLSSGVMLPMLCLADVIGVWYYHRHASWEHLRKLAVWAAIGTVMGTVVGNYIDDATFKMVMAIIIIAGVGIMIWMERGHKEDIPDYMWFAALCGIAGGFTSMIGNLAGPAMAIYFLSMRLPKNAFIGTSAWFFMALNLFKVPLHVFVWKTIDWNTFLLDLTMLPIIALGAYLGILIVRSLNEVAYRWFIIIMTLVAAIFMLLR